MGSLREAAKAVMRRTEDAPQPKAKRRSGGAADGFRRLARAVARFSPHRLFRKAATNLMRRRRTIVPPTEAYDGAHEPISNTLDWLNLWEANSRAYDIGELDLDYDTQQNNHLPHL
jgi:hypothetical protein